MTDSIPHDSILSVKITDQASVTSGSGVLFGSGQYILTVAHLFNGYVSGQTIDIVSANGSRLYADEIFIHHGWSVTDTSFNHDLAIVKLSIRSINQGLLLRTTEIDNGETFTLTGFGNDGALHTGTNSFDGDASLFNVTDNQNIVINSQVLYDYDNGVDSQNASKNLFNIDSSATATANETIAKTGDSGGALLVGNEVVAISSYIARNSLYDINGALDSSYGEIGVATRVSPYLPWIDYVMNGNTINTAPIEASNVTTIISEPFSGDVINYFLLEMASESLQTVSLKYVTRDGTATAGSDYVYKEGWLELKPSETHTTIGVTIYGDIEPESDETFSLVVTDPTGTWLETGVELVATHTISNNDIFNV
tara:strand:+ start:847 stop:1947 length:1101 start_codon:yes stop_codon:yes gene_type:complete